MAGEPWSLSTDTARAAFAKLWADPGVAELLLGKEEPCTVGVRLKGEGMVWFFAQTIEEALVMASTPQSVGTVVSP